MGSDLTIFAITALVLILSITLHEFGHAFAGDRLGDPTPRSQGRVSLMPDRHFDPFGLAMILISTYAGFGLGWGKPVQINLDNLKNVRRDDTIITLAGPVMNLILALISGLTLRFMISSGNIQSLPPLVLMTLFIMFSVNLSLMFFNLLPIFPLDGSHIMRRILPERLGESYYSFMVQYGPMILLLCVFVFRGVLWSVLSPAINATAQLIIGRSF